MTALRLGRWWLALALLVLVVPLGPAPRVRAQDTRLVWSRVAGIPDTTWLEDVVMVDPTLAWAVGYSNDGSSQGLVYRLDLRGGHWQVQLDATFAQALFAVAALDAERGVVAGKAGLIARRDSTGRWSSEGPDTPDLWLRSIQLFDEGQAGWAFGNLWPRDGASQAVALHYGDGRWEESSMQDAAPGTFVNAAHIGPGAGWAVGSYLWRLSGNRWRRERSLDFCRGSGCEQSLTGVRVIDAEHAWLVGMQIFTCMICSDHLVIGRRDARGWSNVFPDGIPPSLLPGGHSYNNIWVGGLAFAGATDGLAVGFRVYQNDQGVFTPTRFALRYSDGAWHYESLGPGYHGGPSRVAMADATRALVVGSMGLLMSYGYGEQASPPVIAADDSPAQPAPDPGQPEVRYFAETSHTLRGAFRYFWESHGGLARFGYPLTEEFPTVSGEDGKTYTVQYFERARLEYHPEYAGTPYDVLLGLLGRRATAGRDSEPPFQPTQPGGQPGARYFPETSHTLAPEFVAYWQGNGGLALYGYPISEPLQEVNADDKNSYLVQYFERARFEYHPGVGDAPGTVLLGLLGKEELHAMGWR